MTTENKAKIQIKYSSINVLKFSQFDVPEFTISNDNDLEYLSEFQAGVNEQTKEFSVTTTLRIKVLPIEEVFCELKVISKFIVLPFDIIKVNKDTKTLDIPENLVLEVSDIIMSTMRGILHERLRGTVLQNQVLPLVMAKNVIAT